MTPKTHTCSYCLNEFPTERTLQLHTVCCLVRLRRIGQTPNHTESAMQQWVRHVRGERVVTK